MFWAIHLLLLHHFEAAELTSLLETIDVSSGNNDEAADWVSGSHPAVAETEKRMNTIRSNKKGFIFSSSCDEEDKMAKTT